jgi:hypothetical protein
LKTKRGDRSFKICYKMEKVQTLFRVSFEIIGSNMTLTP